MRVRSNHGFRLSFQSRDCCTGLASASRQPVAEKAWFIRLKQGKTAIAANPLEPQGKVVSGQNPPVPNGPFVQKVESIARLTHA